MLSTHCLQLSGQTLDISFALYIVLEREGVGGLGKIKVKNCHPWPKKGIFLKPKR